MSKVLYNWEIKFHIIMKLFNNEDSKRKFHYERLIQSVQIFIIMNIVVICESRIGTVFLELI